jgi:hypothetical protein
MHDLRHSDRRCEASKGGAINLAGPRHPNGRIVPFGFFVDKRRGAMTSTLGTPTGGAKRRREERFP